MPARRDILLANRELAATGAVIELANGRTYHVQEHPRSVRTELRAATACDLEAVFHTRAGVTVWIHPLEVRAVRAPGALTPRARKWLARLAFWGGMLVMFAGGAGITLGGAAVIGEITGNGTGDEIGWRTIFPGLLAFYLGGQICSRGFEALEAGR
jgi:hypothetical protein